MIDYIIDNSIFAVADTSFKQVIGIPMGTDPAPFMANLYMFYYEFKWITELMDSDYGVAKCLYGHTRRFIDDLVTLNNKGHLGANWENIYPSGLILNKENKLDNAASFLDLDITVENNQYRTKTYDKRDAFDFDIVSYPDIMGNIPDRPAYGVCIGQILRIAKNSSHLEDFIARVQSLMIKLKCKGYDADRLDTTLRKCLRRYHERILQKYDTTEENIRTQLKTR